MSDLSTNLALPYIMAAQAQKHVTHNEAIRALDAIVQLSVLDRDLLSPPASPSDGDRYIAAAGASGEWTGHDGKVAAYQDGAWMFYTPRMGWLAWVADESELIGWDGTDWVNAGGGSINPTPFVGVNATADTTNRLSLSSSAALFNHEGAGHQLKINKAATPDTASTIYQTGFSGRAEMGLTGDDDFRFKVSADGVSWHEAIVIDRSSGEVSLPQTARRDVLAADRTYHVSPAGNDANDGSSIATPLLTVQAAIDKCYRLDPNGYGVTIQLADGTYAANGPVVIDGPLVGGSRLIIRGNTGSPGNVIIESSNNADTVSIASGALVRLQDLLFSNAGLGDLIDATTRADCQISNIRFGTCLRKHVAISFGATLDIQGDYEIVASAQTHMDIRDAGMVAGTNRTVTLASGLVFTDFIKVGTTGLYSVFNQIWTETGTAAAGRRYLVFRNGVVWTYGKGETHFPGDVAGLVSAGGQYG